MHSFHHSCKLGFVNCEYVVGRYLIIQKQFWSKWHCVVILSNTSISIPEVYNWFTSRVSFRESLPKKQVPLYAVIHVSLHVLFLSKLFPGFLHPQNRTHLPFVTSNMYRRVRLGQLNTSWDRGCLQVSAFVLRKLLISNEASSCCLSGKILFSGLRSKKINRNNYTCNTPA